MKKPLTFLTAQQPTDCRPPTAPVLILFKAADLGGLSFQVKKGRYAKSLKQTKIWPNLTSKIISLIFRELSPRIIKNS